jgi:amino acid adenylation domain-containing protein
MSVGNLEDIYQLSPLQQGILFHSLYAPKSGLYIDQMQLVLQGEIDIPTFEQAWQHVVERHPVLRTSFVWQDMAKPVQVVYRQSTIPPVTRLDWRGLSPAAQEEQLAAYCEADRQQGFELSNPPLLRLALAHIADDTYHCVISYHHILMDGWSLPIVLKEVFSFYTAAVRKQALHLVRPRPYRDYITWLRQQDLAQAEAFWRQELKGFTAPLALGAHDAADDEPGQTKDYAKQERVLPIDLTAKLQSLVRNHRLTLSTVMQATWALLLSDYTGRHDIVFGATVSGRPASLIGSDSMIGLFINTLPVRVQIPQESTVFAWLKQLQAQHSKMQQYEYSPLVEVQGWSGVPRGVQLFESILVFENFPVNASSQEAGPGLKIRSGRYDTTTNYPLTLVVMPDSALELRILYDRRRFDDAMIDQMLTHLQAMVEVLTTRSDWQSLSFAQFIDELNNTSAVAAHFGAEQATVNLFDRARLRERNYWVTRLSQMPEVSGIWLDYPRTGQQQTESIELQIVDAAHHKIRQLTDDDPYLLYVILMAALKVCLYKYTGNTSIVVGSPAYRSAANADQPPNALTILDTIDPMQSFQEFMLEVQQTLSDAYARQRYPFSQLIKDLGLEHVEHKCPLFDIALALSPIHNSMPPVNLDLMMTFTQAPEQLVGKLTFNSCLFRRASIEQFAHHFEQVLQIALENPDTVLSAFQLITPTERQQLAAWNMTQMPYERHASIDQLFETQVAQTPDAIAVVYGADQLTYRELNERANQLAHYLRSQGVRADTLVGLCVERSLELVVGLLGILKANGAFLPLDPAYPQSRLAFMLADSQAPLLLTQARLLERLPAHTARLICLDTDWQTIATLPQHTPAHVPSADNLAYVIYTSGSTGTPKGALIPHRGLCNLTHAQAHAFAKLDADSRVLQFSSLSFDASVFEIVMALWSGATLYLANQESLLPGPAMVDLLRDHAITNVTLPPSVLAALPTDSLPALQTIVVAGEECSAELVARWAPGRHFYNAYGPTEATIWASVAECVNNQQKPTIGRPIANVQLHLLDAHFAPVPINVPGELCIGGDTLARGYLNRPELTAEKFIPNPFAGGTPGVSPGHAGTRLYRTGDLARYLPDGNLEFLGRIDQQVKLRGYRIELGEIEAVLAQHEAVQEVVVIMREAVDEPGAKRLVAYVVPHAGQAPAISHLHLFVSERLPRHMVPSAFVILDAMPLTPNGKLDRSALPQPTSSRPALATAYVPPSTESERIIAGIWQEVLHIEQVGIYDNFFELGGHSLAAIQVHDKIRTAFKQEIPLAKLFKYLTISALAEFLSPQQAEAPAVQSSYDRAAVRRSSAQQQRQLRQQKRIDQSLSGGEND